MKVEAKMKRVLMIAGSIIFLGLMGSYWNPDKREWKIAPLTSCDTGSSASPQLAENGKIVIFLSTCNLAGKNGDMNAEIFKWEDGNFTQLTDTSSCQFMDLALSPNGRRLAFVTNCSLDGKNADQGLELGLMDGPEDISILTQGNGYASRRPSWSADSRLLVFESLADINGGNPDHSNEIYLADLSSTPPALKRISNTRPPGGCDHPAMAGSVIFARCDDDIPGTGPAPGTASLVMTQEGRTVGGNPDKNHEIFRFDLAGNPRQFTYTMYCQNGPPSAQPQGRAVVFMSDCAFSDQSSSRISYGTDIAGNLMVPRQGQLYILTDQPRRAFPDLDFFATSFAWSADGKTLAMTSPFGDLSVNSEHNQEIFITHLDMDSRSEGSAPELSKPSPVTDFLFGASGDVAVNRDGTFMAFESNANPDHKNPDGGTEIYTAVHQVGPLTGGTAD
jgi:Tol biopolymer transport system component